MHTERVLSMSTNEVPNLNGKSTPLYFPITLNMRDYNENLTQTEGY